MKFDGQTATFTKPELLALTVEYPHFRPMVDAKGVILTVRAQGHA